MRNQRSAIWLQEYQATHIMRASAVWRNGFEAMEKIVSARSIIHPRLAEARASHSWRACKSIDTETRVVGKDRNSVRFSIGCCLLHGVFGEGRPVFLNLERDDAKVSHGDHADCRSAKQPFKLKCFMLVC